MARFANTCSALGAQGSGLGCRMFLWTSRCWCGAIGLQDISCRGLGLLAQKSLLNEGLPPRRIAAPLCLLGPPPGAPWRHAREGPVAGRSLPRRPATSVPRRCHAACPPSGASRRTPAGYSVARRPLACRSLAAWRPRAHSAPAAGTPPAQPALVLAAGTPPVQRLAPTDRSRPPSASRPPLRPATSGPSGARRRPPARRPSCARRPRPAALDLPPSTCRPLPTTPRAAAVRRAPAPRAPAPQPARGEATHDIVLLHRGAFDTATRAAGLPCVGGCGRRPGGGHRGRCLPRRDRDRSRCQDRGDEDSLCCRSGHQLLLDQASLFRQVPARAAQAGGPPRPSLFEVRLPAMDLPLHACAPLPGRPSS